MIVYKSKSYSNCRTNAKWILNQVAFWLAVEIWFLVEIIDFSVMYNTIFFIIDIFTLYAKHLQLWWMIFLCAIQWNNAYLIHFGAFLYFCFPSSSLYLTLPLIFFCFASFFITEFNVDFVDPLSISFIHFFQCKGGLLNVSYII